jgi:hypothetical protein
MPDTAHVLLAQSVLPEGAAQSMGKPADREMLVMTSGGRQRTVAKYRTLLGRSGLRLTRVVPSADRISLLDAVPDALS